MPSNKYREIPIAEAELSDLRAFCEQEGLPFTAKHNTEALRALILKADPSKDRIVLVTAPASIDISYGAPMVEGVDLSDPDQVPPEKKPWLVVEIQLNPGPGGEMTDVYLDVDGRGILVPRGKFVPLAYKYYESLAHARKVEYAETENGLGEGQHVHTYPFQLRRIFEEKDPEKLRLIQQNVARQQQFDKANLVALEKKRRRDEALAAL